MRKRVPWTISLLALASFSTAALAQNSAGPDALVVLEGVQSDGAAPQSVPAYGVTALTSIALVSHAFHPVDSNFTFAYNVAGNNLTLYRTGGVATYWMEAPITLPNGSQIEAVEFRFCDTNASAAFASFLNIMDKSGAGAINQPAMVTSTNAETPGCINRTFTPASPIPIDNENKSYGLEVNLGTVTDASIGLSQARVYYRLNVSPDPAGATFGDVPVGHPFHRFIEALAAAGITGGCGGGNYCPNNPVTRGQMAVFLSVALGLHFPN